MCRVVVILLMLSFTRESGVAGENLLISRATMHRTAVMSVKPETLILPETAVSDTFTDSIYISNVQSPDSLWGWNCKVHFDGQVLETLQVSDGPFLVGWSHGFLYHMWGDSIKLTAGLLETGGGTGSGTIAYIKWRIKKIGSSVLRLSEVEAVKYVPPSYIRFPCDSADGYFRCGPPSMVEEGTKCEVENIKIYPNPFNRTTEIRIQKIEARLPEVRNQKSDVRLTIYDLAGRLVKSFHLTNYPTNQLTTISWDGSDESGKLLPGGIYFCKLQVKDESVTKQLLLMR